MSSVHVAGAIQVLVLTAGMIAQSAPPPCPAGRPVDEIINEIHRQQNKNKHRITNPLPDVICLWGWCRDRSHEQTPPTIPESAPATNPQSAPPEKTAAPNDGTSSSKHPEDQCREAVEMALEAAHNVEIGDYYFKAKNNEAALMRYKDALEEKPGDLAIHVRLGRVFERLGELPQAMEQYKAAQQLSGPQKWADEASKSLHRLQRRQGS
jgi:Tetratricopeptide repeat